MRCENKTFLQNDPGFLQEISSTAVEVGLTGYSSLIGLGKSMPTKRPLCETWARMSHPDPNGPPDRRPIKVGEVWENPVTGERLVILERPWDNPASRVTGEPTALVGARVMGGTPPACSWGQLPVLEGALSL